MGGAAGHMAHPFDLGSVRTGNDLIDFFNKAKEHLETEGAGAVKIDGVNVSFKVVEIDGQHEFAVDRGSLKEIDIRMNNDIIFKSACSMKYITLVEWLCSICTKYKIQID